MIDEMSTGAPARGRRRNPDIDERILAVASTHLSVNGYEAMSLTAIAHEAGTTRQALYRRWPTKASLATEALNAVVGVGPNTQTEDALGDLVTELTNFQRGVSRPGRLSLVGAMLQENTPPEVLDRYRERIVAPRRQRIREILERARNLHLIDSDADLEVAVTLCSGAWYARALAEPAPPRDWPTRTARLVWRAVGGSLPRSTA